MSDTVLTFTTFIGGGVIALQGVLVILIAVMIFRKNSVSVSIRNIISSYALLGGFGIATGGTILSLVYSQIFGLEPCQLCWWQRIFLYPQVILFGVMLIRFHISTLVSALILSIGGCVVALYHIFLQFFPAAAELCIPGAGPDCSFVYFKVGGYVTFAVMSATAFVALIVLLTIRIMQKNERTWYDTMKTKVRTFIHSI